MSKLENQELKNQELKKERVLFLKSGFKALAPMLIDAASNAVKNRISGMGTKRKRTTKLGRPRKTKTGAALMPAGY